MTLMGPMFVRAAYYHCPACRSGHKPWEHVLQLKPITLSPAAEEITAMAGVLGAFGEGAERVLQKMAALRLSESTVQRITEAAGERVAKRLEAGESLGPQEEWAWQKDARGQRCAYKMPAFRQHGILLYFAAWKNHIGLYPPISGDAAVEKAVARYAGPKGNLQFPLDEPIPYNLIKRIVKLRVKQDREKSDAKRAKRKQRC
jgi:uncharacterized protein YdhG (YjbR/CyaY superfamily)